MIAKPQIDQQVITKLRGICAGETDHVTLMAVAAGELFHAVDGFDWVGFYRVVAPGVKARAVSGRAWLFWGPV
jgi:GAF domain-containing protein